MVALCKPKPAETRNTVLTENILDSAEWLITNKNDEIIVLQPLKGLAFACPSVLFMILM